MFFNNKQSPDGAIVHSGDNVTGEGAGDDEQIVVDLTGAPAALDRVVFPVSIYEAETARRRTSGRCGTPSSG